MMGRRRFLTRILPTTFGTSIWMRSLSKNAEAKTVERENNKVLTVKEMEILAAWCSTIVPGAGDAGVAKFVDQSLAGDRASSLLLLRYLNASDMAGFYRLGLAGIEQECTHRFNLPFVQITKSQKMELVEAAVTSDMQIWTDPDPNFFYFISRSDAVDVVYGTQAGFSDLNIPYLAHIQPPRPW